MYEMATGQVPFDHENGVTIALMHLQNEITPPGELIRRYPGKPGKDHSQMYHEEAGRPVSVCE